MNGYSLLEVLTVISIFSIIIGLASVSFLHTSPKYRLIRAVREIHSRMNYARYRSIYKGTKVRIILESDGYTIQTYSDTGDSWIPSPKVFLEGVVIEANNSPTFHPIGTVSNLASITISNTWGKYKISLAISGRIKVVLL
jgi:prepilin-type N-terminal cleavage/methylation domain-containing protein